MSDYFILLEYIVVYLELLFAAMIVDVLLKPDEWNCVACAKLLCKEYMGKFPVISIILKGINGADYATARSLLCSVIGYEAVKNWYDGYLFGDVEVYCPWDVISYCDEAKIQQRIRKWVQ